MSLTNDTTGSPRTTESELDRKTPVLSGAYQTENRANTNTPEHVAVSPGVGRQHSECSEQSAGSATDHTQRANPNSEDDDGENLRSVARISSSLTLMDYCSCVLQPGDGSSSPPPLAPTAMSPMVGRRCSECSEQSTGSVSDHTQCDSPNSEEDENLRSEHPQESVAQTSSSLSIIMDYSNCVLQPGVDTGSQPPSPPPMSRSRPPLTRQRSCPQSYHQHSAARHKRIRSLVPRIAPRLRVSWSQINHIIPEEKEEAVERKDWVYVPLGLWCMPRRDKLILLSLGSIDLTLFMCLSILAPFYPEEAASRGVSGTVSGWVFGCFALVQFIFSPIFGYFLPKLGSRFMLLSSHFLAGGCTILFGLLDYVPYDDDGVVFVAFCFLIRVFMAVGCTASATASFAIMVDTFPDNVATVFGLLETFTGVGLMLGPALGGILYEAGGFMMPFVILGILMILSVPVNMCILPVQEADSVQLRSGSFWHVMCIPAVMVVSFVTVVGAIVWAILDPTLAPHLDVYGISPAMIGMIFVLMSAFYALSSPLWGWIADKMDDSTLLMVAGFVFSGLGLLLLGPSTLLGFVPGYRRLWLDLVALIILGMAVSLSIIPTFEKIIDAAEKAGVEDNVAMYSHVAGLWGGAYALGDFIGPILGGFLVDMNDFEWCMNLTAAACALAAFVLLILWIYERKVHPTPCLVHISSSSSSTPKASPTVAERQPLLDGATTTVHDGAPPGSVRGYGTSGDMTRSLNLHQREHFLEYEPITQSV